MNIRVEDIPDEGLIVEIDQEDGWAVRAAAEAVEGEIHDLRVELQLSRIAELLRISGKASARAHVACARCGGDLELALAGPIELLFEPFRPPTVDEEHLTDPAELDLGFFDGVSIELSDVVMEQFALWLPDRVICGLPQVQQRGEPWRCELPRQPEPPGRENPFAKIRISD